MGAMLPPVYQEATDLAKQLKTLADNKSAVVAKAAQARNQAEALRTARTSLDHLLEQKSAEQAEADAKLSEIHDVTEEIGREASDLKALIDRVASLRANGNTAEGMTVVTADRTKSGAAGARFAAPAGGWNRHAGRFRRSGANPGRKRSFGPLVRDRRPSRSRGARG